MTGTVALGVRFEGIGISLAPNNLIGGTAAGAGNLISGNKGLGIDFLTGGPGNVVQGNFIGTDVTGNNPLPNPSGGIYLESGTNTTIIWSSAFTGRLMATPAERPRWAARNSFRFRSCASTSFCLTRSRLDRESW